MADEGGKAWQRALREVVPQLPGEWAIGRPGAKAIIAQQPIEWRLVWVGMDRVRATTTPFLIAGVVPLASPFALRYTNGLRSDYSRGPGKIDLLSPDVADTVLRFVVADAIPVVNSWPAARMAAVAEEQFAQPPDQRGRPLRYPDAAGWRVVNDTGSPVEPAQQAADQLKASYSPDEAAWYEALVAAWNSGGRPAALAYLEQQRAAALVSLKLM